MAKRKQNRRRPSSLKPDYQGKKWISVRLPTTARDWSRGGAKSVFNDGKTSGNLVEVLGALNKSSAWKWPKRQHFFISDLHGDPDAFAASLVASGGIKKTGPRPTDFVMNTLGNHANFIIGGDCFDKGPSSLELLRTVRHLMKQKARVRILAGNHDIRVLLGMRVVDQKKNVLNEHFFIRTGPKIIPLLREVWDEYLVKKRGVRGIPSRSVCRKRLFPREAWFDEFDEATSPKVISPAQVKRELIRIRKKMQRFEEACGEADLELRQVYAAVQKWKSLFLEKKGEFNWFYRNLRLCYRSGSFLFVHAGLDDSLAKSLSDLGVARINRNFRKAMYHPATEFYYGPLCNAIRTKYRDVDRPFTARGAKQVRRMGIAAIIHGHRNLHNGQRLTLRRSIINFECDTSLDRHTRKLEKVDGRGASVTILDPKGYLLGVSSDYPHIKVFQPQKTLNTLIRATK